MPNSTPAAPCWPAAVTLTLLGEEGLVLERRRHGGPEACGQEVAEVAVAGVRVGSVQLRLDADWMLEAGHAPLEDLGSAPFVLAFEEPQFSGCVLHTLPLLDTQRHGQ